MKVNNDCHLNFRAAEITPRALQAMSERMPSGRFSAVQDKFLSMYKDSPFDIIVDTLSKEATRLSVKVKKPNSHRLSFVDYIEEPILYSIFRSPEKFLEKACKNIDKLELDILGKRSRDGIELIV